MSLMYIAVGIVVLIGYLLFKLRATSPPGIQTHSGYEPFFGVTRHEGKQVLKDKSVSVAEYNFYEMVRNGYKAYGWGHIGGRSGVVVVEPEDIKYILRDNFGNFEKAQSLIDIFETLLGDGIFNTNGAAWKDQRIISAHMFNRRQLRDRMSEMFGSHAQELVKILIEQEVGSSEPTNMQPYFYNFTFDTINRIAFNREVNSLRGNMEDRAFQRAFDVLQSKVICRFLTPWWKINRYFQCSEDERQITESIGTIDSYLAKVVNSYYDDEGSPKDDVVKGDPTITGLFLENAMSEGRKYDKKFIRDMILNFAIAGRDTTGSALTSCVELLVENPKWQDELHKEAMKCFAGSVSEPLTFDDIQEAPVSKAVFLETLRLRPSVPINEKVTLSDTTLPSGVRLRAGDQVGWLTMGTNRNPKHWGPSADEFDPKRWLDGKTYEDHFYPTFNAGPRLCLGREMAILEGQITLLTLFSQLRFSKVDGFKPKLITFTPHSTQVPVSALAGRWLFLRGRLRCSRCSPS
eukprot:TRINITY_DN1165_c4_g1_i1.p1 TRINITY_DN1165_c4_g1~~TRINITY_DN1165_c4_g1_i1.p1  ORF type:complete len:518 (+),score=87.69 TRINITY_DN1165_c4_g1_i1:58-1611(+)